MSSYYNKKTYKRYKKYKNYKKVAGLTKAQKKEVKRLVNKEIAPEMKYASNNILVGDNRIATNGTVPLQDLLTRSAQGLTDVSHIGDTIKIKSLHIRLMLEALATYTSGLIRVFIYQWKDDNEFNPPTVAKLFMTSVSGNIDSLSPPNEDTIGSGSLGILYDKTLSMVSVTQTDTRILNIKVPLKWAKKNIEYKNGQPDMGTNHIYITVLADKQGIMTNAVQYSYTSRMYFTDA